MSLSIVRSQEVEKLLLKALEDADLKDTVAVGSRAMSRKDGTVFSVSFTPSSEKDTERLPEVAAVFTGALEQNQLTYTAKQETKPRVLERTRKMIALKKLVLHELQKDEATATVRWEPSIAIAINGDVQAELDSYGLKITLHDTLLGCLSFEEPQKRYLLLLEGPLSMNDRRLTDEMVDEHYDVCVSSLCFVSFDCVSDVHVFCPSSASQNKCFEHTSESKSRRRRMRQARPSRHEDAISS